MACNHPSEQEATEVVETVDTTVQQTPAQETSQESDERSNWQKPEFVLESLGPLEGKTVADIGTGALGYFAIKLVGQTNAEKIIGIDIDKEALNLLNIIKDALPEDKSKRIELRLAESSDPHLRQSEVDVILIVNTIAYIRNRVNYFQKLKASMKEGAKLVIIDFKTKRIPEYVDAPAYNERVYLHVIEEELYEAGFTTIETDDTSLEFQFYISAEL